MDVELLLNISVGIFFAGMGVVVFFSFKERRRNTTAKIQLLINTRNLVFLASILFLLMRLAVPSISIVDYTDLSELKAPNSFFIEKNNQDLRSFFHFLDFLFQGLFFVTVMLGLAINQYVKSQR